MSDAGPPGTVQRQSPERRPEAVDLHDCLEPAPLEDRGQLAADVGPRLLETVEEADAGEQQAHQGIGGPPPVSDVQLAAWSQDGRDLLDRSPLRGAGEVVEEQRREHEVVGLVLVGQLGRETVIEAHVELGGRRLGPRALEDLGVAVQSDDTAAGSLRLTIIASVPVPQPRSRMRWPGCGEAYSTSSRLKRASRASWGSLEGADGRV